jgi:hypothetical protein
MVQTYDQNAEVKRLLNQINILDGAIEKIGEPQNRDEAVKLQVLKRMRGHYSKLLLAYAWEQHSLCA